MRLTVGFGARPDATADEVLALLGESLSTLDAVTTVSTVDGREELASAVAQVHGWRVVTFPAAELAQVEVPSPSARVASAVGTPSVAEAAALLAARGPAAVLLHAKRSSARATVAVAAPAPDVTVVGIGADGYDGLTAAGRDALAAAEVVLGSARQLGLLPAGGQRRVAWPSPLVPALPGLLAAHHGRRVCVLASGDPMYHGIGSTLVRLLGRRHVTVVSHPSSVALACARLGWALDDVAVVSAVGRSTDRIRAVLHDGRRVLVLSAGRDTPLAVARILEDAGFADSEVTVLEALGGPDERIHHDVAAAGPLNIVAVACRGAGGLPLVPGLDDARYTSDGQLTKREIRAVTLAALGPRPGELLWDVGAGSGSIAVEWLRAHPSCRAVAIERDPVRAGRVAANADRLGVPQLSIVEGAAPAALDGLPAPDAVFIGGGVTVPGVFERCWAALRPGGRLVVNAVTVESERRVFELHETHGGELTRIAVNRAAPVGGFLGWRPMLPVTQWVVWR
ncbi:precorrin-6y C5,15-methyltransferase (decarboxylating) subunit CbiE [Dactylosporangium sucinum]|uniref:Precorrin-6Y C(5,15)-methyltransferase [decarboxylating] n=1 Tax=Dactylosporangium sucinum TaxID=1424081 RepID=A0A917WJQ4_9ACTN|nr:precorrin-6y C5,15-methyltransferase (decarboxylating) subunit CbiE [Dactylosporangium sucinum]GGM09179.1 precorrin-6Y C(5,15)-methyltransferase [decarboxylating] [Dactylosporangium sucinum]